MLGGGQKIKKEKRGERKKEMKSTSFKFMFVVIPNVVRPSQPNESLYRHICNIH